MKNPANTADSGKTKSATSAANETGICFGASETTCFHGGKLLPKAGVPIWIDCQLEFFIGLEIWEHGMVNIHPSSLYVQTSSWFREPRHTNWTNHQFTLNTEAEQKHHQRRWDSNSSEQSRIDKQSLAFTTRPPRHARAVDQSNSRVFYSQNK